MTYYIRAFKATDDLESCRRFAEGHKNVLLDYGITKVTTANTEWFYNPGVHVVIIESENGEVLGGDRIHIANDYAPLPVEQAVSVVDKDIFPLVDKYRAAGTGELCGLWNSKQVAGKGLSVLLTKVGVALAGRLGMESLFVLCAPYTVQMCANAGFAAEESIGNKGTFNYPKLDLVAKLMIIRDVKNIPEAEPLFRDRIFDLRERPLQVNEESGPQGSYIAKFKLY